MSITSGWDTVARYLWRMPSSVLADAAAVGRFPNTLQALARGYRAAESIRSLTGNSDPWVIAALLGVPVEHHEQPPVAELTPGVRSEYECEGRRVLIYTQPLARLAAVMRRQAPRLRYLDLGGLHLAHELYHYLEHCRPDLAAAPDQDSPRLSELAAHAFTQALLDLDFFPAELDSLAGA